MVIVWTGHTPSPICLYVTLLWALCLFEWTTGLDNGLAKVPPMGWNSWNTFHCQVDQNLIVNTAQQIKLFGLDKLGYVYVNIDDCWMDHFRTHQGKLIGHPQRFSKGMKWMGDYLHSLDLKFGIYSSAGLLTCAGYPASLGSETVDAQTFAEWGVDYLKYDNCYNLKKPSIDRYAAMRNALNATGRPILYSLCQWGTEQAWQWAHSYGNTWRTTGDIEPIWKSIEGCFWQSQQHFEQSRMGDAWLDPDMLEVGNGALTYEENKSHFALWVLAKAPLLLGNDLMQMPSDVLEIISNRHLIDIHQDPFTPQAICYHGCARTSWCPPKVDGEHVHNPDDMLNINHTCTIINEALHVNHNQKDGAGDSNSVSDDYSVLATTRGRSGTVIMLVINWNDVAPLSVTSLNVVQLLGVAPFSHQHVVVHDLHTGHTVSPPGHDVTYFDFDDLKQVPIPALLPHDCIVYSFTTMDKPKINTNTLSSEAAVA